MLKILFRETLRKGREPCVSILAVATLKDLNALSIAPLVFFRSFGDNKPHYRSKYALRQKEERETRSGRPLKPERPAKHFEELKFYHARNRYGQKETLIDSRRRDIDFFDPVAGGFDRDPRIRYEYSGSEELSDEEAALFADFSDTDDEDIYFGGGNDADGDFDDEGNELRPKVKVAKWADPDLIKITEHDKTDPDEDEREFNEVFETKRPKNKKKIEPRFVGDMQDESIFQKDALGSPARVSRKGSPKTNFTKPDPEIGMDAATFRSLFNKKTDMSGARLTPERLLEDDSDSEGESEFDEEKMMREGDEEMAELNDVSDMIRDYDRPQKQNVPITEDMAEKIRLREMQYSEGYKSDDIEKPDPQDPRLQEEIAKEHEMNVKRLQKTRGGRKMLKRLEEEYAVDDLPNFDRSIYEDALERTPRNGGPLPRRSDWPNKRAQGHYSASKSIPVIEKDHPLSSAGSSKSSSGFRTVSVPVDIEGDDADFHSDLKEEEERRFQEIRAQEERLKDLPKGRSPFGGSGVRYYSTASRLQSTESWIEDSKAISNAELIAKKRLRQEEREMRKAMTLHRYWSFFPPDGAIEKHCQVLRQNLKHKGTLYVAMTSNLRLLFGVAAPHHEICSSKSDSSESSFVKLDRPTFHKMRQRGEIITGGPFLKNAVNEQTLDWTGNEW